MDKWNKKDCYRRVVNQIDRRVFFRINYRYVNIGYTQIEDRVYWRQQDVMAHV